MSKKSRKQRERKRTQKKEEAKLSTKKEKPEELILNQSTRSVRNDSLNYLILWKNDKIAWKFKKSRQVFLLKHMYNIEKVPTKHFKILKKYIKSMQSSNIKDTLLKEALAMIENPSKEIKYDDIEQSMIDNEVGSEAKQAMKDKINKDKIQRAEKIAKILSKE
eukprot:403346101